MDKVCSYAFAALTKALGALAVVHQGMFPHKTTPSSVEGLAAPFGAGSSIMADYTHAQTVHSSELTFQLLLGHKVECDYEKVAGEFPKKPDGKTALFSHTYRQGFGSCDSEEQIRVRLLVVGLGFASFIICLLLCNELLLLGRSFCI